MIRTLGLVPIKNGYGAQATAERWQTRMDGPVSRQRRAVTNTSVLITCTFRCTREGYRYLRAFYRTATKSGSLPFYLQAVFPYSTLTAHKAYFVPGSLSLQDHNGRNYTVQAQITVEQTVRRAN